MVEGFFLYRDSHIKNRSKQIINLKFNQYNMEGSNSKEKINLMLEGEKRIRSRVDIIFFLNKRLAIFFLFEFWFPLFNFFQKIKSNYFS